jgi:hypothetical protein
MIPATQITISVASGVAQHSITTLRLPERIVEKLPELVTLVQAKQPHLTHDPIIRAIFREGLAEVLASVEGGASLTDDGVVVWTDDAEPVSRGRAPRLAANALRARLARRATP